MSARQPEDQLAAALTNLGRSVEIWADLAASGADCTTMKSLIRQNAWTLESSESICASKINSQLLQRLAVIGERSQYLKGEDTYQDSATTSAITTLSVRLLKKRWCLTSPIVDFLVNTRSRNSTSSKISRIGSRFKT